MHGVSFVQTKCGGVHGKAHLRAGGCRDRTLYASTSGRSSLEGGNGAWMRPAWHAPSDSIVSLVPSATEILFALGLGHRCACPPSCFSNPHINLCLPNSPFKVFTLDQTDTPAPPGVAPGPVKILRTK